MEFCAASGQMVAEFVRAEPMVLEVVREMPIIEWQRTELEVVRETPILEIPSLGLQGPPGPAGNGLGALGWRFFQDARYTALSPFHISAGVRTQIPNDGRGMLTSGAGVDSSKWLDFDTAEFYPDKAGDIFLYRLNLVVVPSVNNKSVQFDFDIGTPNSVFRDTRYLSGGAGVPVPLSIVMPIVGSATMVRNGGRMNVWCDSDVDIYGLSVLAIKQYGVP